MSPSTATELQSLKGRGSRTSILSRLEERRTTKAGSQIGRGQKRTQHGDSCRESPERTPRGMRRRYCHESNTENVLQQMYSKPTQRIWSSMEWFVIRKCTIERTSRAAESRAEYQECTDYKTWVRSRNSLILSRWRRSNNHGLQIEPFEINRWRIEFSWWLRWGTETIGPAQLHDELEGLRIRFSGYREKVGNAVSMREELNERLSLLKLEFYGSKLDIATMLKAAVQDE